MLKKLKRHVKLMELIIDSLPEDGRIIELRCDSPEESGQTLVSALTDIYSKNGLHPENSQNPSFYTLYQPDITKLNLSNDIRKACAASILYTIVDKDLCCVPICKLWKTFIGTLGVYLGHHTIFSSFPDENQKRLFLCLCHKDIKGFLDLVHNIENIFHFSLHISAYPVNVSYLKNHLKLRLSQANNVYLCTDTEWIKDFYIRLGDDLSRASLLNFLRQRIFAKVFWDCDTYYTLTPPVESAEWRRHRLRENITLPPLESPDPTLPFLYLHTFTFEQYAIPGIIEANPGDTVLDIGACIGDTSVYFSHKIKNTGTCFAFEPLDVNLKYLKKNITQNQCGNVALVPFALSSKKGTGTLKLAETATTLTPSLDCNDKKNGQLVHITTVDDFSIDKHIDFIKADIEGAELDMLYGARETLRRDKPVCALSLYHKEDDFRTLPQYIQTINPDYTFYIRCDAEPMLFAACR